MANTTVGTINLIATIDTDQYKKGVREIDAANDNLERNTGSAAEGMNKALSSVARVGFAAIIAAATSVAGVIISNFNNAIKRVDTLNNSARTFANMGFAANDVDEAMKSLTKSIKGLPTPLDAAVKGVQLIASSTNDVKKSQKIFSALNNAIIGFGGSTAEVSNATVQLSQDLAGGRLQAETWNSLLDSGLGPTLAAIARQMGITTRQLKEKLGEGSVSVESFTDSLISMNEKGGGGMQSLQKIALDATSGIETGFANMNTSVTRGLAEVIKAIGPSNISGAMTVFGNVVEGGLKTLASNLPKIISGIRDQIGNVGKFIADAKNTAVSGDYKALGFSIGNGIQEAIETALRKFKLSVELISNWFSSIDWGKLGIEIGRKAVAFGLGLVIGLLDFDIGAAFQVLKDNWFTALLGLLSVLFLPAKLLGPLGKILSKIPFGKTFIKYIIQPIRNLGEPVRAAFTDLFGLAGGVVSRFFSGIGNVLKTLGNIILAPIRLVIEAIAEQIRLIPLSISETVRSGKNFFLDLVNFVKTIFSGVVNAVRTVLSPLTEFFKGLFDGIWNQITTRFTGLGDFFGQTFIIAKNFVLEIVRNIVQAFANMGSRIGNIVSSIVQWFVEEWQGAGNIIKGAFNGIINFFRGWWGNVTSLFGNIGTSIGNAIGGAVKGALNAILGGAGRLINGFIESINSVVGVINRLPGVRIGRLSNLAIPQLAQGGIVSSPTVAMIGEGRESEAVIPLSKLDAMLNNEGGTNKSNVTVNVSLSGIMSRSKADERQIAKGLIESINQELRAKNLREIGGGALRGMA